VECGGELEQQTPRRIRLTAKARETGITFTAASKNIPTQNVVETFGPKTPKTRRFSTKPGNSLLENTQKHHTANTLPTP
jgi:hypothetical protein